MALTTMSARSKALVCVLGTLALLFGPASCDDFFLDCSDGYDGLVVTPGPAMCAAQDHDALLRFKASISADPNHVLADWHASQRNCCDWNGVTCDGITGRVVRLTLQGEGLKGKLAPELGKLSSLRVLCLGQGGLSGPIPESLGQLSNLVLLDLSSNALSGPLPASIGGMSSLQFLYLSRNSISGPIPPSFGLLSNMYVASLIQNQLSGRIPDGFARNLTSLLFLYLENNRITGVPQNLRNVKSLEWLTLSHNPLVHWEAVEGIGTLPQLSEIEMVGCNLTGPMPNWVTHIPQPGTANEYVTPSIDFSDNAITGEIPAGLGNLTNMESLNLSKNKLKGPIPVSLSQLMRLGYLNVSYNELSGQIPPFGNITKASYTPGNQGLCGSPLPPCKH